MKSWEKGKLIYEKYGEIYHHDTVRADAIACMMSGCIPIADMEDGVIYLGYGTDNITEAMWVETEFWNPRRGHFCHPQKDNESELFIPIKKSKRKYANTTK